jgi:hypothetical protein
VERPLKPRGAVFPPSGSSATISSTILLNDPH